MNNILHITKSLTVSFLNGWRDHQGHTSRRDFWLTKLAVLAVTVVLFIAVYAVASGVNVFGDVLGIRFLERILPELIMWGGILTAGVISAVCELALLARRFNDAGFNRWLLLTLLIPGFGFIPLVMAIAPREGHKFI
jgi:uncharacterized membrane protein YhaH (DUF805 family)